MSTRELVLQKDNHKKNRNVVTVYGSEKVTKNLKDMKEEITDLCILVLLL